MSNLSVIVVAHESEPYLDRCLRWVTGQGHEVVVVDNASTDNGVALVRRLYPDVRVIELDRNVGFGAGNNEGLRATSGEYVLLLNPDAWPLTSAVERLVETAEATPWAAVVGPRLLTPDGGVHQSVRGFPTVWRLATEYFFLRWLAPRSRLLNAFYGAGIDQTRHGPVEWVVGAALLLRRSAIEEVGGFDPSFFMYNDEVDLCYRLRKRGWAVVFTPHAEFIHVGSASTRQNWSVMYREQLRSHIRFLAKHKGLDAARRGRRVLLAAMRLRSIVLLGERRSVSVEAAQWLAERDVQTIVSEVPAHTLTSQAVNV